MPAPGRFGAVICAMATPFDDDGGLDMPGAVRLARWLVDNGNDGLVLAGTTGEAPTLNDDEKLDLWRAVREAVSVPVIANTGTASTAHSVELTRAAEDVGRRRRTGRDPLLQPPFAGGYRGPFPRHCRRYGTYPSSSTTYPSGRAARCGCPPSCGWRRTASSPGSRMRPVPRGDGGFDRPRHRPASRSTAGTTLSPCRCWRSGRSGVISVASHWAGPQISEMIAAFTKGDTEAAMALNARLVGSWEFEGSDEAPNPVPTKAMLRVLGLPGGECRLPMGPEPEGVG